MPGCSSRWWARGTREHRPVASEPNPAAVWPVRPRPAPAGQRAFDLLLIGDCNPDVLVLGDDVTPAFGQQEKLVPSMSLVVGGSASITAVAAARLGLSVARVAAVGDDSAGQFMLDQMAREGVGADAVAVRDDTPTGMTVALSSGGDRAILTALGAVGSLAAGDVPGALLGRGRARAAGARGGGGRGGGGGRRRPRAGGGAAPPPPPLPPCGGPPSGPAWP